MRIHSVVCLIAVSGMSPTAEVRAQSFAEEQVMSVFGEVEQALLSSDIDRLMHAIHDDAVWMTPGRPPLEGKAAIQEFYAGLFERFRLEVEVSMEEIVVEGDLALVRAQIWGSLVPRLAQPDTATFHNKFLNVYRRGSDGRWKLYIDMYNSVGN